MPRDHHKIPLGTRVRHLFNRYEGWIVGWTDRRESFEGQKTNPDGKQCRIYIHKGGKYRCSAEEDLDVCNDIDEIMDPPEIDERYKLSIGGTDFAQMPVPCTIWTLGLYHARPLLRRPGDIRSENRDLTMNIQSLKFSEDEDIIRYFYDRLNPLLKSGALITTVPSSDPHYPNRGIIALANRLCAVERRKALSCLFRMQRVMPQHIVSDRTNIRRQLDSIEVRDALTFESKAVLLLDDIVKTGTSLMACKKLLLDAGASEVFCLAMGKAAQ